MIILNEHGGEITTLDMGILEAGKKKVFDFFLSNDSGGKAVDINVEIAHDEIEVVEHVKTLAPGEKGPLKVRWKADAKVKKGVKAVVRVTAKELYE